MNAHVLIVEDNVKLAASVKKGLQEHGCEVNTARNGADAIRLAQNLALDVVLLDLGLPDMDGMDLIKKLRKTHPQVAVLITSARDGLEDRVQALELGSDDYLVKPFPFAELVARINAVMRRMRAEPTSSLKQSGGVELHLQNRRAFLEGGEVDLPPKEFDLLAYLIDKEGEVVSRSMLARDVWRVNVKMASLDNTIDVYISRLRDRLKQANCEARILTRRGVGFTFVKEQE